MVVLQGRCQTGKTRLKMVKSSFMGCSSSRVPTPPPHENKTPGWPDTSDASALTLLFVDDEVLNNRVAIAQAKQMLPTLASVLPKRLELLSATSNNEARAIIDSLPAERRCIVFLDQIMPEEEGGNGEVLARERSADGRLVLVACTANVEDKHLRIYRSAGFDGVLHKPLEPVKLRDCIHRFWIHPHRWWSSTSYML